MKTNYPTILLGFVQGPLRFESDGKMSLYPKKTSNNVLLNKKPFVTQDLEGPTTWAVTHIQYRSHFGFLISLIEGWKPCFHVWIMPTLGDFDEYGNHVPGTEKGWYFRVGWPWRADEGGAPRLTWYGPFNSHWD
jgi:hypothetical protein